MSARSGKNRATWWRAYFFSDTRRTVQTVLGLIWLLDGGLQFQSFMYSRGFVQLLAGGAQGQPGWLADSINWGARMANGDLSGLLVWPNARAGGLLGVRGAKTMWAVLWLVMAWLWLTAPNSSANATHDALTSVDSGIGWLNSLQSSVASAAN